MAPFSPANKVSSASVVSPPRNKALLRRSGMSQRLFRRSSSPCECNGVTGYARYSRTAWSCHGPDVRRPLRVGSAAEGCQTYQVIMLVLGDGDMVGEIRAERYVLCGCILRWPVSQTLDPLCP